MLILLKITLNAQNSGSVTYRIKVEKEIKKIDKKNYDFINKLEIIAKKFELKLNFSKNNSFYELVKPMKMNTEQETLFKMAEIVFKSNNKFYTSLNNRKIITEKNFLGEIFLVEEAINETDWNLVNEQKLIGNYNCFKAERIYRYESRKGKESIRQEVWYAPALPFAFGPSEFVGFPGLVIEVKSGNIIYYAEKIEIFKNNNLVIKMPLKGKKISPENFNKIAKEARENFLRN